MDTSLVYDLIFNWLRFEDKTIKGPNSNKGIFFMPELHFVFEVGKLLKIFELEVFGKPVEWLREQSFDNSGPIDLLFRDEETEEYIIFEFKIATTWHAYFKDIEKLKTLKDLNMSKIKSKYFIALTDVFSSQLQNDPRVQKLKKKGIEIHESLKSFEIDKKISALLFLCKVVQ
ncbi:hypothetical protein KIM67_01125 [Flagellimonas sp. 389]|uniref:hypothetical protein n=1 Tax=Flagellimonas sp. 389 TaxID=2835862 RepID=UPI001BD2B3B7|nr:hypothetical protein [Flagellimonas sp. 389]MBS9460993.1 hypothetical protein [Flagellimonas sp. 389]